MYEYGEGCTRIGVGSERERKVGRNGMEGRSDCMCTLYFPIME